jgi:hypothetical protein
VPVCRLDCCLAFTALQSAWFAAGSTAACVCGGKTFCLPFKPSGQCFSPLRRRRRTPPDLLPACSVFLACGCGSGAAAGVVQQQEPCSSSSREEQILPRGPLAPAVAMAGGRGAVTRTRSHRKGSASIPTHRLYVSCKQARALERQQGVGRRGGESWPGVKRLERRNLMPGPTGRMKGSDRSKLQLSSFFTPRLSLCSRRGAARRGCAGRLLSRRAPAALTVGASCTRARCGPAPALRSPQPAAYFLTQ